MDVPSWRSSHFEPRNHRTKEKPERQPRLGRATTHLKEAAIGKPSPEKGMAMLRRGRAKSDLAKARNKRAKASK